MATWVGQPFEVTELSGETDLTPAPLTWVAPLQDVPHFDEWTRFVSVQVFDHQIPPNSATTREVLL